MTDRYKTVWETGSVSDVLAQLFRGKNSVSDISNALRQPKSTVSTKLRALDRDELVEKDKWTYTLNRDRIYEEVEAVVRAQVEKRFDHEILPDILDDIFDDDEIRQHLMHFVELEIGDDQASLQAIVKKYREEVELRYEIVLPLSDETPESLPERKRQFSRHLAILQALLPRPAHTAPSHGLALVEQLRPEEEYGADRDLLTFDDVMDEIVSWADQILEEEYGVTLRDLDRGGPDR